MKNAGVGAAAGGPGLHRPQPLPPQPPPLVRRAGAGKCGAAAPGVGVARRLPSQSSLSSPQTRGNSSARPAPSALSGTPAAAVQGTWRALHLGVASRALGSKNRPSPEPPFLTLCLPTLVSCAPGSSPFRQLSFSFCARLSPTPLPSSPCLTSLALLPCSSRVPGARLLCPVPFHPPPPRHSS